jgi:hypothetical protein
MVDFEGNTLEDKKLWNTYVFWAHEPARSLAGSPPQGKQSALADDPKNRVSESLAKALQTILFSSFVLDYRMRRVFEAVGIHLRPRTTLGPLLSCFWPRLAVIDRLDKNGKCLPPPEWSSCEPDLQHLVQLRNDIAHADYKATLQAFSGGPTPDCVACQLYNSVVEAVKLINIGTGYDVRSRGDIDVYFEPLNVP